LQAVPTPVALYIVTEVRNVVATARFLDIAAQITLMISSQVLRAMFGVVRDAASDLAKKAGINDAWIQSVAKAVLYTNSLIGILTLLAMVSPVFPYGQQKIEKQDP
jgi:hypothetical protein